MPSAVGLLRQANLRLREEMVGYVHGHGFADVSDAQMVVFRAAGPDGRQPGEIATAAGLSKQSINDVLGNLEQQGYLKRKPHPRDGRARVIQLTARGRRLDAAIWEAGRVVELAWRNRIGELDWQTFREILDRLAPADDQPESR